MIRSATNAGYTLVCFHAHPDDEAILTAGTMAKAAADGHRVVLVVATAGDAGPTSAFPSTNGGMPLGRRRLTELRRAAALLGCARVECLGYADSGLDGAAGDASAFARTEVDSAASRLAALLVEERADVLTVYDRRGGYGHPDHEQVHRVGVRAAQLAGIAVVAAATADRRFVAVLAQVLRLVRLVARDADFPTLEGTFTPHHLLTHRIDVRDQIERKRAAMAAHASQTQGGSGERALAFTLRLPSPIFRLVFGWEWFTELGRTPARQLETDLFATLASLGRPS